MPSAEERSCKASTDIRCLCQENETDYKQHSEELSQCCDRNDMLIDKYCKDCES